MTTEIIPFDRRDAAHQATIHRMDDDEPAEELVLAFNGLISTLQQIEAGPEPLAAALAREALTR